MHLSLLSARGVLDDRRRHYSKISCSRVKYCEVQQVGRIHLLSEVSDFLGKEVTGGP